MKSFLRRLEKKAATASMLIFVFMLITKLLGFLKLRAIAQIYGASKELDVFWAAFAIPDLIFTLLIAGTVNAALIPVFIKVREKKGHKEVLKVLNSVINWNFIIWFVLWLLVYMLSPVTVQWLFGLAHAGKLPRYLAGALYYDEAYIHLFVKLTRILFISPFILGLSSIYTAFLNAYKRFTAASLAPLMYNLGILLGLFTLYHGGWARLGVYMLVVSVILGSIFHLLVQVPEVLSLGYRFFPALKAGKYVKEILSLSLPRILGLAVEQLAITFDTFWSLFLGAGALSIFKYASSLQIMPVHLFGNSILQATFPSLNENAARNGKSEKFVKMFLRIMVYLVWILGFTATVLLVLKIPIVKLALGTGKFTDKEVLRTALTLAAFSGAIVFYALSSLVIRAFYALHQTKKPFLISVFGVIFNIIFSILFSNLFSHSKFIATIKQVWISKSLAPVSAISFSELWNMLFSRSYNPLSVVGLAAGISVALMLEVILSLVVLNTEVQLFKVALNNKWFKKTMLQVIFANIVVYFVGLTVYNTLKGMLGYTFQGLIVQFSVVSIVSFVLYLLLTYNLSGRLIKRFLPNK